MKEQLQKRLQDLSTEYAAGQKMLAELEAKQANLRNTLLRISGAIQILEEMLHENLEAGDVATDEVDDRESRGVGSKAATARKVAKES